MRSRLTPLVAATVLLLCTAGASEAQMQGPTAGLKVGPSLSSLAVEPDANTSGLLRGAVGGFARFEAGRFNIQPEILLVTKGATFATADQEAEVRLTLNYVEMPLLLLVPFEAGAIDPHIYAGPAISFERSCTIREQLPDVTREGTCAEDEGRRQVDFGGVVGAGVNIPIGAGALMIEARYNHGLVNLLSDGPGSLRNRFTALLFSYALSM